MPGDLRSEADWGGIATLDNGLMIEVDPGRFEDMVATALDGLPEDQRAVLRRKTTSMIAPSPIASARCTATLTGNR